MAMCNRSIRYGALGLLAAAATASADTLVSNFSAPQGVGTIFGTTSTTIYKAAGFTMPAQDYELDRVTLTMDFGGGGTAIVSIWTGAGVPQTQVAVLNSPPQIGAGDFAFTPSGTLTLQANETYWVYVESIPNPTGNFLWQGTSPSTVPSGVATFVDYIFNGASSTTRNRIDVEGTPAGGGGCYPNCDGSTTQPVLNVNDFICFQAAFAAGDSYANCDGSTTQPVLNVNDFICFQAAFAAGCR